MDFIAMNLCLRGLPSASLKPIHVPQHRLLIVEG